jgi:hypothetical protein
MRFGAPKDSAWLELPLTTEKPEFDLSAVLSS